MNNIFTPEIKTQTDAVVAKYETKRASILEVLRLLQDHYGYISTETEEAVAEYLGIPAIDVHEVITFYSLFYTRPKAKTRFHVCRTLACSLLGGKEIVKCLEKKLGIKSGEKTADGQFSLETVECLGACEIAPMMQLNDREYIGPLTEEKITELIEKWKD
ncbi:MAG TPA: NADH-quinone oxidoreductase subunit NuoE [bacterium]|nr:NADH-quinone oxidoreductase subunit NuoE [bacterium]